MPKPLSQDVKDKLDDVEWLKDAYESGLTIAEIGNLLGVSKVPVNKALVRHGISKRSSGQSQRKKIGVDGKIDDLDWIAAEYSSGRSSVSIARELGSSHRAILKRLKDNGTPIRDSVAAQVSPDTYDVLRGDSLILAYESGCSIKSLADKYGVSQTTVTGLLKRNNVPIRSMARQKVGTLAFDRLNDREWLSDQLATKSAIEVADELGIHNSTVSEYARAHSIGTSRKLISFGENEVAEFLSSYCNLERSNRKLISKELDIYVPSARVAVEFNGLYWHSEKFKPKNYHYEKFAKCQDAGIRLIQVWEDDWLYRKDIVKSMLLNKLGFGAGDTIYARDCSLVEGGDLRNFFNENHIQGYAGHSKSISLVNSGLVVASALFRKNQNGWLLSRYATSCNVPGGFSKCLTNFRKRNDGPVVTFADLCISDGSLYVNNGFKLDKILPPDYSYLVGNQRVHKFSYRKSRFARDENLLFDENATERELAVSNGLLRVYDAGKLRFITE